MDFRFALRSAWKNPGFTLLAVAVLALGIGANTAIFSVVNGVLLRPLPYSDPDRIVTLRTRWQSGHLGSMISLPDFQDLQAQSSAFRAMGFYYNAEVPVIAAGASEYAGVCLTNPELFAVIGVSPVRGRLFTAAEGAQGAPLEAVVSSEYWRGALKGRELDGQAAVSLEGKSFRVIGVLPDELRFPAGTDIWVPSWAFPENLERSSGSGFVIARLKPTASMGQAQTQLSAISARLERAYPGSNRGKQFVATALQDQMVANVRLTLWVLLGAVALVLLIACANVANLLLARGTARAREIAIQMAIGAGRGRIMGGLLLENLTLALLAGAGGMLAANWGMAALTALAPKNLPRMESVQLDWRVLAFALAIAAASSLLSALAPALQLSRTNPAEALHQGGTRGVVGGAAGRIRAALVVTEVALSVVLLVSAGLLLRSFAALSDVNPGFNPHRLLVAETSVPAVTDAEARRQQREYFDVLLRRMSATPGVESAALTVGAIPNSPSSRSDGSYIVEGQTLARFNVSSPQAGFNAVSPEYFRTMGIAVESGRAFDQRDSFDAPSVAIVSATLARRSFPQENPVGKKILTGWDSRTMQWMTIVGVAGDVRMDGPGIAPGAEIYMPYQQHPRGDMHLIVRTAGEPMAAGAVLERTSHQLNAEVPVRLTTMDKLLGDSVAAARFRSLLLAVFAGLALLLAMVGIYGVMAYVVGQRTAEMGLRMALGADRSDIVKMVLGQVARLAAAGLAAGTIGSVAATRLLESLLYGVKPRDPVVYGAMLALLGAVALAAGLAPAWRAARVEPLEALRRE